MADTKDPAALPKMTDAHLDVLLQMLKTRGALEKKSNAELADLLEEHCPEGGDAIDALVSQIAERLRAAVAQQAAGAPVRPLPDHDNHHNALKCPYCNPNGMVVVAPTRAEVLAAVNKFAEDRPQAEEIADAVCGLLEEKS